jgi:nitrogen regulatory protein P-II 2
MARVTAEPALSTIVCRPLPPGTRARVVALVRPVRVDAVMEALAGLGALAPRDVLIEQVRGYGRQKTHLDFYEEGPCEGGFVPKVRLQFTVDAGALDAAVNALRTGARTGRIGDGKIFVHAVEHA